jgi:hypothetical protein
MSMESGMERHQGLDPQSAVYRWNRLLSVLPGVRLRRYLFVEQPVRDLPKAISAFQPDTYMHDDLRLAELWPEQSLRRYRFGQGARCLVVARHGRLAGGIWFADQTYIEDEVRATYRFGSAHSWDFGLYIHPNYRATRAFAALWGAAAVDLAARGKQGSLSRIADYLAPSLQAHARMGAKSIGCATFLSLATKQYCWSSGAARRFELATGTQFDFNGLGQ